MTTSASVNFTINRDEIIRTALEDIGFCAFGDGIDPNIVESAARKLNLMVKAWMAKGAHLWAMSQATLFLVPRTASYSLGPAGANCSNSYEQTTLSVGAAASATTLSLTATTGMSAGDNIGILLDSGTIQWTTISGAPGSPTTIANALTGVASAGAVVFAYTTRINRPQRIDTEGAYWRSAALNDTPIRMISRDEYAQLSNKTSYGKIVQAVYDPQLGAGTLSVWPTPDLASDVLRFWYERPLEDFDAAGDTPDFPIEWGLPLTSNLADLLVDNPRFQVDPLTRARIKQRAVESLDIAMGYDRENTSILFQPDLRY